MAATSSAPVRAASRPPRRRLTSHPSLRVAEARARTYKHVWKGSVFTSFLSPLLYLAAMGFGLGSLIDRGADATAFPGGYVAFLAPGLLAATAMTTGVGDCSWPVMGGIRWNKTFHAAIATPVAPRHIARGMLLWVGVRLVLVSLSFVVVAGLLGAAPFARGLVAVAPAVLVGWSFAAIVMALTAVLQHESGLASLYRFGVVPMFLFSGTFFPVTQLPDWLRPLAYVTPLWHGVALTRWAWLGTPTRWPAWVHALLLAALIAAGLRLSERLLHRRLVT